MGKQQEDSPLLEKLLQTMDESKELIRRMHEAEKDLKAVIAEARGLHQEMLEGTRDVIQEIVAGHAAEVKPAFQKALDRALVIADGEIRKLVDPLMDTLQLLNAHYERLLKASECTPESFLASFMIPTDPQLEKMVRDAERRNKAR